MIDFKEILNKKEIKTIIDSPAFFFQEGQDSLKKWLNLDLSKKIEDRLIELSSNYDEIQKEASSNEELSNVLNLLFEIISYCDTKAKDKTTLNRYEDKRALANAFVRMNNWIEHLILFKLKKSNINQGSPFNAFNYLLDPENNTTILSESHRELISENLFGKNYHPVEFVNDLRTFFHSYNLLTSNPANYTHLLARLIYSIQNEWKEEVMALMASDGTGWQDQFIEKMKSHEAGVVWNSKRPSGTNKTIKFLKNVLDDVGSFNLYYSSGGYVKYKACVIDFVVNQNELDKKEWEKRYSIADFSKNFEEYIDEKKIARIIFLIKSLEKIDPIPITNFQFCKGYDVPRQDNLSPVKTEADKFQSIETLKLEEKMNKNDIFLNQILYGPPGTGKTYKIQNEYCQLFTDKQYTQSSEEKLREDIKSFPWWKVVAAVLYKQSQPIDVKTIASDILAEAKYRKVKTPATNIIWNELLTSGDDESSKLDMKYRAKTQLFKKDDNSRWSLIDKTVIETVFPDIVELSKYNNSVPEATLDNKRYKFVTFHQKYSYEDFIEGIRPVLSKEASDEIPTEKSALSFELRKGIFYQCCLEALELAGFDSFDDCYNCSKEERKQRFADIKNHKEKQYAIFIDEINRANISAVFGELITLIEEDKRIGADNELWLELPGSNSFFAVPSNLYIIGTMNTADKSIALVDIALRRRFEFLKMYPDYDLIPEWSDLLRKLNESIYTIKRNADFFIGHSFFIDKPNTELPNIFNRKIIPLLLEYFQNNTESVKKVLSAANIMVTEDDNHQIIA